MKMTLKASVILVIFCAGFAVAWFIYGYRSPVSPLSQQARRDLNTSIPAKYFDLGTYTYDNYLVSEYVEIGELPTTEIGFINYSSDIKPFLGDPKPYLGQEPSYPDPSDVDGDGRTERVIVTSTDMTRGPHRVTLVKDNNQIFEISDLPTVSFIPSPSGNGFYIRAKLDESGTCCESGYRTIRFIYENGKFTPVWEQKTKYLRVIDEISAFI